MPRFTRPIPSVSLRLVAACLLALASFGPAATPARGQAFVDTTNMPREAVLLKDFVHYVMVGRWDLADGSARVLIESPISDAELYRLVDELDIQERLDDAFGRAANAPQIQQVAAELETRIREGRLDVARDPDEIARHIGNLQGTLRARGIAERALREAGEFAVPQLLEVLRTSRSIALKADIQRVLVGIGRQAVTPLTVALPHLDAVTQERVADILRRIGYPHARPALYAVAQEPETESAVREALMDAFMRLGGSRDSTVAGLWEALGEAYWDESDTLIARPGEETNIIWTWEPRIGLLAEDVPTEIYSEIMAMRSAENSLAAQRDNASALALWVASNFRRSDQLPRDAVDPTYTPDMRPPVFYAEAAGPAVNQRVLARANADLNTQLARHAISALGATAGGATLWTAGDRPSPLVRSLSFPERRVRYDAALALGRALPTRVFTGSDRVVTTLASILDNRSDRYAAVVADNQEDAAGLAANLRSLGFTVLPPAADFEGLRQSLVETPGIDLFLIRRSLEGTQDTIDAIQSDPRLAASPILAVLGSTDIAEARFDFGEDPRIEFVRLSADEDQIRAAIDQVIERTLGELISAEEAENYAREALFVLRDIALKGTAAFDVNDAEPALIDALDAYDEDLYVTVAETLSWISTQSGQRALMDAALGHDDDVYKITLLEYVADSAKRFGRMVSARQVDRLLDLVANETGPVATAAARAHGALDLPASNLVGLIVPEN